MRTTVLVLISAALIIGCLLWTSENVFCRESSREDLLSIVQAGVDEAHSAVKSGKGDITVRLSRKKNTGGDLEIEKKYSIAFSGRKFRLSAQDRYVKNDPPDGYVPAGPRHRLVAPGEVRVTELAYDSETVTRLIPNEKLATIGDANSPVGTSELSKYEMYVGILGLGGRTAVLNAQYPSLTSRIGPQVVGREYINGDECIIVERVDTLTLQNGEERKITLREWVNPGKGFTTPRIRVWWNDANSQMVLQTAIDAELREYGNGLWGASKLTQTEYRIDPKTGQSYVSSQMVTTYDPDFQLNVPVQDADLTMSLPTGTRVYNEVLNTEYVVP